jgi:signal transduction histidine kinase
VNHTSDLSAAEALLHEREARGLRLPVVLRAALAASVIILILTPAVPAVLRTWMLPILATVLVANLYGLRLLARREKLRLVGYAGVAFDVLVMAVVPFNLYFTNLDPGGSPALITKTHYPIICASFIVLNAVATRPAYPLIATVGAGLNYLGLLVLALAVPSTRWTTDAREVMTSDAVSPVFLGITIVFLIGGGLALTYFNASVRRAVVEAAQLEATHAQALQQQTKVVMDAKMDAVVKLVAGVSHELNTPLGTVRSGLATLRKAVSKLSATSPQATPERRKRLLHVIGSSADANEEAIERIADVMANLDAFARGDEADYKSAAVGELLDNALSMVPREVRRDIACHLDVADAAEIQCYPAALSQSFLTLLTNAFESIDGDGAVRVAVNRDDDNMRIEINDDGRGIPEEALEHIFDVKFGRSGGRVSAGFGLPICRSVVERHGGDISVRSAPGDGTRFLILLPVGG